MTWTLSFTPPAPMMSLNDRKQWWQTQPSKVAWRDAAQIFARQAIIRKVIPANLSGVNVLFDFPVRSLTRRDAHNVMPTVKACIDGMVKAGLFVDDSTEFLSVRDSVFHKQSENPNVNIYIEEWS